MTRRAKSRPPSTAAAKQSGAKAAANSGRRAGNRSSDALPVSDVLLAERGVEAVGVAGGSNIRWRRAFAEHLLDGVSGNEVDKQEDQRHDEPDHRQGVEDALEDGLQFSVLSSQFLVLKFLDKNDAIESVVVRRSPKAEAWSPPFSLPPASRTRLWPRHFRSFQSSPSRYGGLPILRRCSGAIHIRRIRPGSGSSAIAPE